LLIVHFEPLEIMKYSLFIFSLALACPAAFAQNQCARLKSDQERLSCYDQQGKEGRPAAQKVKAKNAPSEDPQIAAAHASVRRLLKDPDSARFESSYIAHTGAVCGLVNAKNSYGGYAGASRFIVTREWARIEGENDHGISYRWSELCEKDVFN
jgi:hypothetical protein